MITIVFTHIPKTAGRSMRKAVFEELVAEEDRHVPRGFRMALRNTWKSFRLLTGHIPYGIHRLYRTIDAPRYFVMLRDPVERAVSHYYFIKHSSRNPSYTHPNYQDASQNSLVDFYRKPIYQNMQARYVAGLGWEYLSRRISLNGLAGRWIVRRATQNLIERYEAFGLQEYFEESAHLLASHVGVEPRRLERRYKATPDRPAVSDLSADTVNELRCLNSVDVQFYRFAREQFSAQLDSPEGASAIGPL